MDNKIVLKGTQNFLGKEIKVIEGGFGEGKKSVLAKDIAEIHNVETKYINKVINNNISRFNENDLIDFLSSSEELRDFAKENGLIVSNRTQNIFLLSERGYIKVVSMMDNSNDKKWEVMDKFIDNYFKMQEAIQQIQEFTRKQQIALELVDLGGLKSVALATELSSIVSEEEIEKATESLRNGNEKTLTATEVVKLLDIKDLNTTIFHEFMANKGWGVMVQPNKKRVFQPNEVFEQYIAKEGYAFTGKINKGKKYEIRYAETFIGRINERHREELERFVVEYKNIGRRIEF